MRVPSIISIIVALPCAAMCMVTAPQAAPAAPETSQQAVAFSRLQALETSLSKHPEKTCYMLRAYRYSGNSTTFRTGQKPAVSNCQPASALHELPAK